ncbi:MAG: hypothetical protein V7L14_17930 [Nostoc sp.]
MDLVLSGDMCGFIFGNLVCKRLLCLGFSAELLGSAIALQLLFGIPLV